MKSKDAEKLKLEVGRNMDCAPYDHISAKAKERLIGLIDSMTEEESAVVKVVEVEKLKKVICEGQVKDHFWKHISIDRALEIIDSLAVEREPVEMDAIEDAIEMLRSERGEWAAEAAKQQLEALKVRNVNYCTELKCYKGALRTLAGLQKHNCEVCPVSTFSCYKNRDKRDKEHCDAYRIAYALANPTE